MTKVYVIIENHLDTWNNDSVNHVHSVYASEESANQAMANLEDIETRLTSGKIFLYTYHILKHDLKP